MELFHLLVWLSVLLYTTLAAPLHTELCVSSCKDRANGDYQSCSGCDVYVTCSNGILYDNRRCPATLVWSDQLKRCARTSSTCGGSVDSCTDDEGVVHQIGEVWLSKGCRVNNACVLGSYGFGEIRMDDFFATPNPNRCVYGLECRLVNGREMCVHIGG